MDIENHVQLIGNLGADPKVSEYAAGRRVARFSVATNERVRNVAGEFESRAYWHSVVAFGKNADKVEAKCRKGTNVIVWGRLINSSYVGKDGVKRFAVDIVVEEILCRPKVEAVAA